MMVCNLCGSTVLYGYLVRVSVRKTGVRGPAAGTTFDVCPDCVRGGLTYDVCAIAPAEIDDEPRSAATQLGQRGGS